MSQQFLNLQTQNDNLLKLTLHITRIIKNNPITTIEKFKNLLYETNILSTLQ